MMATENQQEDSVLIRLSVIQPGSIDHPERRIRLTESEPTAKLGRSSSRPSLGLYPAITNGWYNSPVMSRHHAEVEADFANATVGITDLGSMHGTFLNKTKVAGPGSRPTRIQVGDELTLGLPVFRNHEEFHPALMRVDGLEFCEASRQPTTTPTRTFTVPDDCSTDDNEPMDDSLDEDEAIDPGTNANVVMIVEETAGLASQPNPRLDTHLPGAEHSAPTCQSSANLSHQVDGADDNANPEDAFPRPGMNPSAWSEMSSINGSSICNESAGPPMSLDDLTSSEDDDQDADSLHNIGSGNSHDMQNASFRGGSRSPSWDSFPSDSEGEGINDDSAMDESASEGFAMFEEDSDEVADEAVINGRVQPDTNLEFKPQTEQNLQAPSREVDITRAPVLPSPVPQLPPISSVISTGPNDWMSCSHSNWGPRSPSPSDAVLLPRHCRTDAANSDKTQGDAPLATSDQVVPEVQEGDVGDSRTQVENSVQEPERVNPDINTTNLGTTDGDDGHAEVGHHDAFLGKESGKVEFFAARAINKRVHDANMQLERLSEASPQYFSRDDGDVEQHMPFPNTPELADSHFTFVLAPYARGLSGEAKGRDTNQQPKPADPQRRSLLGDDYPYGLEAAAWSSFDPDFQEPSSAYEMQNLKSKLRAITPLGSASKASRDVKMQNAYETMVNTVQAPAKVETPKASYTFEHLKHKRQLPGELDPSALANGLENTNKGKRKAAEISEGSPAEYRWAFSSKDKSEAVTSAEKLPSSSYTAAPSTKDQTPLPSPPPSPEEVTTLEHRPTKKIKRIAERVGYAALGGVSVGAMVLTSLIYTAPNFV